MNPRNKRHGYRRFSVGRQAWGLNGGALHLFANSKPNDTLVVACSQSWNLLKILSMTKAIATPNLTTAWKGHSMYERLTLIKFRFTCIGISLPTYTLAVQLSLLKEQHVRTGRNTLQPWVNYSLNLNLNLCRKSQLNPGRISLLKRKAQHRKKLIQRKKHGKVKNAESPVYRAGLLFTPMLAFWFRTIAPGFSSSD
jgi:hypothetical protein